MEFVGIDALDKAQGQAQESQGHMHRRNSRKTATAADEDDCMATWSMFGVDDLELDDALRKPAGRPEPALSADISVHSRSAAPGSPLSSLGDHIKPVDGPAVVSPISSSTPGTGHIKPVDGPAVLSPIPSSSPAAKLPGDSWPTAAPPLQSLTAPATTQSPHAPLLGMAAGQGPLTSPNADRSGKGSPLLAEGFKDVRLRVHPSSPDAEAAVGQPADTEGRILEREGRMLEGEPGSVEVHEQLPQGKNAEPSEQPAEPGQQRVASQNSPEGHHSEGMPLEEHGSGNIIQHIPNSPAEVRHQGIHQPPGTPDDPCCAPQHKTQSRPRRLDLHTETSNSKHSPPENPETDSKEDTAVQQSSTRAESPRKGAQILRPVTVADQPRGNANTPGEKGNEPAHQCGTSKPDHAAVVGPTARAQAASCEQRCTKIPGLETSTPAADCPQPDAVKSSSRGQTQTAAAGSFPFVNMGAPRKSSDLAERQPSVDEATGLQLQPTSVSSPHKSSGLVERQPSLYEARGPQLLPKSFISPRLAERQPSVNVARGGPQLQPASISHAEEVSSFRVPALDQQTDQRPLHKGSGLAERRPTLNQARGPQLEQTSVNHPQDGPSLQHPPTDRQTDQRPPSRELQKPLDTPLPAKPVPQSSLPADSVAQAIQVRAAGGSNAQLPAAKVPARAAERHAGYGRAAGKAPTTGLAPQAAAAAQQRKNGTAERPLSSTLAAAETCPKKRPAAEPPAYSFSLPKHQALRKRANTSALDTADTGPGRLATPSAANGRIPGFPLRLKQRAADAKFQAGADAERKGTASSTAAPLQNPLHAAVNIAASNQIPAAPSQNPLRTAVNLDPSNQILPFRTVAAASKAAAAAPESKGRQQPQVQPLPHNEPPRRSAGAATRSRFATAAGGGGTGPLAGVLRGPIAAPSDNSAVLSEDYKALMRSAREELSKSEEHAQLVQCIDARIHKMRLELEAMHFQTLELRVQAAIAGNRLVRLDNPIVAARMQSLQESLLEMLQEP